MYNKKIIAVLMLVSASIVPKVALAELTGCAAKKDAIQKEMDYAKANGNSYHLSGLEKAYSEVEMHCTDASLKAEREANVSKKERKVADAKQDLAEAQASGRSDKIMKKTDKLEKAEDELTAAKAALSQ